MGELGYLAYLATHLSPPTLAGTLSRRMAHRLRRRAADPDLPPSSGELLEALGGPTVADLPRAMAARSISSWANPSRAAELRQLAPSLPGLAERVMSRAEAVANRRVSIYGRPVTIDGQAWTRDPETAWSWDDVAPSGGPTPHGDPKRVWALGRMDWAVALAQAAWLAYPDHRHRFVGAFTSLTTELFDAAPCGQGIQWASPMEVALRGANLATALLMLQGDSGLGGDLWLRLLRHLWQHAVFTRANIEDQGAVPNNHLVAAWSGLFQMGSMFPELPGFEALAREAAVNLGREAHRQVLPDGMGFEGSVAYHRLLLELLISAWCATREAPRRLGLPVRRLMLRMLEATRRYIGRDGQAPAIGDDDSGRALALTGHADRNHAYLSNLGAALFGRITLKVPIFGFPDEAFWLCGASALRRFQMLPSFDRPSVRSFPEFGMACLTAGARELTLACGGNGQRGIGGHGHNDKLSVEIRSGGAPVVVDPGVATYAVPELRNLFRSTAMHSTVQLDREEQSPIPAGRLFALPDRAHAHLSAHKTPGLRAEASHQGYCRRPLAVVHTRQVELDERADACRIVDVLAGTGVHLVAVRFHLANREARVRRLHPEEASRLGTPHGHHWYAASAVEIGPEHSPLALWVMAGPAGGEIALEPSAYSVGYDRSAPALCIEAEWRTRLPLSLQSMFLFFPEI